MSSAVQIASCKNFQIKCSIRSRSFSFAFGWDAGRNWSPDVFTFNATMSACAGSQWQALKSLLIKMQGQGLWCASKGVDSMWFLTSALSANRSSRFDFLCIFLCVMGCWIVFSPSSSSLPPEWVIPTIMSSLIIKLWAVIPTIMSSYPHHYELSPLLWANVLLMNLEIISKHWEGSWKIGGEMFYKWLQEPFWHYKPPHSRVSSLIIETGIFKPFREQMCC